MNHVLGGFMGLRGKPLLALGLCGESFVVRVDRSRLLTARGHFHAGFDTEVLGDAAHNHAQVAHGGVAATL